MNCIEQRVERVLTRALFNLFFYRAKSVTLDMRSMQSAQVLIRGIQNENFAQYQGKIVRVDEAISPVDIYDTARLLIERYTSPARPDILVEKPFSPNYNYIGLRLHEMSSVPYPCPILVGCISKSPNTFFLQFTAQNLEQKLDVLRTELDAWHSKRSDFRVNLPNFASLRI